MTPTEIILYSILVISLMGLIFGLGLGYAGNIFYSKIDPNVSAVRDVLPGANCGACGYVGCDDYAKAVAQQGAPVNGCPVGGEQCAKLIADIMGVKPQAIQRTTAFVRCAGDCDKAATQYDYVGLDDCKIINQLANHGPKNCYFGCLGYGNCVKACQYDAITIINGIAKVDDTKCAACKRCVAVCPRKLIEMVPYEKAIRVQCDSTDNAKTIRANCSVGCIGCKLCEKTCKYEAISVHSFLAKVDYDKCVMCGECVKKCPTNAIHHFQNINEIPNEDVISS